MIDMLMSLLAVAIIFLLVIGLFLGLMFGVDALDRYDETKRYGKRKK